MPRDGSGVYHRPIGTDAVSDTTIESSKYNTWVADVETDLNTPRPIVAGGTGASSAAGALANLGGESAKQIVTNYDTMTFLPGSFYSAGTATNPPVAGHAFSGICYQTDASNMFVEAHDQDDSLQPGRHYTRQMKAGVWSAWATDSVVFISDTPPTSASPNSLWWESDSGLLFVRYNDGDSTQWVLAMPMPDVSLLVQKAGDTMTGPLVLPGNPTTALQAAPKQYVDSTVSSAVGAVPTDVVRYGIAQGLTAAQRAQARANIDVLKRNYVINGAMMIAQEWGPLASSSVSGGFIIDQFGNSFSNAGAITYAQVASPTPGGSQNRLRTTVTTADAAVGAGDYAIITQSFEGLRTGELRFGSAAAKTVTIQFGVKAPAGTYCVAIQNNAQNRVYVAEYTIAAGEANTDVVKSVTIPGDQAGVWPVDTTRSMLLIWTLMGGTTYQATPGAWQAGSLFSTANQFNFMGTIGNIFELFDVGMYEGPVAPPFQMPDYTDDYRWCGRYVQQFSAASGMIMASGAALSTTATTLLVPLRVPMRATPSFSISSVADFGLYPPGIVPNGLNIIAGVAADNCVRLDVNVASGLTVNSGIVMLATNANAKFRLLARP